MDLSNENVLHIKKDGIEYLQFRRLLEFDNLINCYTLRPLNYNKKTLTNQELEENYNKICKALEIERENLIRPHQSHTDCIENVDRTDVNYNDVDGFILTCKDHLIPFYERCGFKFVKVSASTHGNAKWNDMVIDCRVEI